MTPLLPKHVWEKIDKPPSTRTSRPSAVARTGSTTGRRARRCRFSRFADHFQAPANDGVLVVFFGTREGAYTALVKKEADVLDRLLAHQVDELQSSTTSRWCACRATRPTRWS